MQLHKNRALSTSRPKIITKWIEDDITACLEMERVKKELVVEEWALPGRRCSLDTLFAIVALIVIDCGGKTCRKLYNRWE